MKLGRFVNLFECDTFSNIFFLQSRSQIFSALHYLHREYEFYLPLVYIERRILELSMETCLNEFKLNGGMKFI
jgi:hypothetical protein